MLTISYVIPMIIIILMLGGLINGKYFRLLSVLILSIFIIAELISLIFSGRFIDYQFYVNLNINDMLSGIMIFPLQAVLSCGVFIIVFSGLYFTSSYINRRYKSPHLFLLLSISIAIITLPSGPIRPLYEIVQVVTAKPTSFSDSLRHLGVAKEQYIEASYVKAEPGKNIIIISLESLEQNFLNDVFNSITPNLQDLTKEFTYFNRMPMSAGSSWTLASLYTYMTGVPLFMAGYQTQLFPYPYHSKLTSLGDILNRAGYESVYILGNPEFANMGNVIRSFGISTVSEHTYPNRFPDAPFGLYDQDIFQLATEQLSRLKHQRFALFISTVSTHAINGFYDARMEQFVAPQASQLEFTIASLDYSLGKFINELKEQNLLTNTVIYLFPDHLLMGSGTSTIRKLSFQPRQLYLLTNASEQDLGTTVSEEIYQLDLPRLIINGAHIKTNATFLTDYLTTQNKSTFIQNNKPHIATLNASAIAPLQP